MRVRYSYRLRPGRTAVRYLVGEWGRCRWVWNQLVEASQRFFRDDLGEFGYRSQDRMLTEWRSEHDWLGEGSSVCQQQTVRDFALARTKALLDRKNDVPVSKRRGLPRFKSRHHALPSLNYTRRGFSLREDDSGRLRLRLPGGVMIPVVWSRKLPSDPGSARVYQDSVGDWYVSFVVEADSEPLADSEKEPLGVDWGVREIATTTDDAYDLAHPEHGKKAQKQLTKYQRMMSRRRPQPGQPASKGFKRAKRRAAMAHKKIARQRRDTARKWAKRVVRDHDRVAVEDFRPKFLARSTMARKAADAAIAATKNELQWMATKHGRDLRLVDPSHTTMDCSGCDARTKHRLPLSERTYACELCGLVTPRDKNSAAVMVARAGFDPADADGVRPVDPAEGTQAA